MSEAHYKHLRALETFDIHTLPDLDAVVLGALERFERDGVPEFDPGPYKFPLVVGSGNAAVTGEVLYDNYRAVFANESTFSRTLDAISEIDGAVLISSSGEKHAVEIAKTLQERGLPSRLLTNNPNAPAAEYFEKGNVFVFPKNREPYTYNTSTYMGMILSKTKEDPKDIREFIEGEVALSIPNTLGKFDAFFLIVPAHIERMKKMLITKFDELFGPEVSARAFTLEEAKHAKTIVSSPREMFTTFGEHSSTFGTQETRLHIPLPNNCGYAAMMAVGYYLIGRIQRQHPPHFKKNIESYARSAYHLFGAEVLPIVE